MQNGNCQVHRATVHCNVSNNKVRRRHELGKNGTRRQGGLCAGASCIRQLGTGHPEPGPLKLGPSEPGSLKQEPQELSTLELGNPCSEGPGSGNSFPKGPGSGNPCPKGPGLENPCSKGPGLEGPCCKGTSSEDLISAKPWSLIPCKKQISTQ